MKYVKKICPICGSEFIVLKKVEEKAVYCTLECLLISQERMGEEKISPFMSV
ncbi:hypothetical protein [Methanosarcina siciliae]|uniref:hypothetical protein n=1 Tax=Methanosarcina siciliae TaxID=38027 RepID=UPI000A783258|nr:hypothetical protein [Methanosarcina siciliae]